MTGKGWERIPQDERRAADTPWFQSLLTFDPAKVIKDVRQPLLFVHGELDKQVPVAHADRLADLARKESDSKSVEVVVVRGVNHLLLPAITGEVSEYATLTDRNVSKDVSGARHRVADEDVRRGQMSASGRERHSMSGRQVRVPDLRQKKQAGEKIAMLTAYDATMARLLDRAGVDVMLVGDSLGIGHARPSAHAARHARRDGSPHARRGRGTERALVVADMPFLTYQVSVAEAVRNAGRLLQRAAPRR